jgi:hypothetical protein
MVVKNTVIWDVKLGAPVEVHRRFGLMFDLALLADFVLLVDALFTHRP